MTRIHVLLLMLTMALAIESARAGGPARAGAQPATGIEPAAVVQSQPASAETALPSAFGKTFRGRVGGKAEVRMYLDRKNGELSGRYSYTRIEDSLLGLIGTVGSKGDFTLNEFTTGKRTGVFRGTLTHQAMKGGSVLRLSGTWSSADGRRSLPFELQEEHLVVNGEVVVYSGVETEDKNEKLGYDINVTYPLFESARPGLVQDLNGAIKAFITEETANFRKHAEEWTRERRAETRPGNEPIRPSDLMIGHEMLAADHGLVSLRFSSSSYFTGAAHPAHGNDVLNYSLRERKMLALQDLFSPGSAYLKTIAEYCIEELELDDQWRGGAEPKPDNYRLWNITADGLLITFNEYQVGPYVAGSPEVTVPYSELAAVLRRDGPAAPFAKR